MEEAAVPLCSFFQEKSARIYVDYRARICEPFPRARQPNCKGNVNLQRAKSDPWSKRAPCAADVVPRFAPTPAVNINVFAQLVWFTAVNLTTQPFSHFPRAGEKTKI
jgi:hypothetical protein